MRYGFWLIAFALLLGCGPSERDQQINEAPLAPANTAPATTTPPAAESQMPATDADPADSEPADSTPADSPAAGSQEATPVTDEQLKSASLEEIEKRIDGNPNDRAAWDLYVAKVGQLAKASLEKDAFDSLTIIENGLRFFLKHNYDLNDQVRNEVVAQTESVWNPISDEAGKQIEAEAAADASE